MKIVRKFILSVLLILLTAIFSLGLLAGSVGGKVLQPESYKKAFAETGLYSEITKQIKAQISQTLPKSLRTLTGSFVSESWVEIESNAVIEGTLSYLKGETQQLPTISLDGLKTELSSNLVKSGLNETLVQLAIRGLPGKIDLSQFILEEDLRSLKEMVGIWEAVPIACGVLGIIMLVFIFITAGGFWKGKGWAGSAALLGGLFSVIAGILGSGYVLSLVGDSLSLQSGLPLDPQIIGNTLSAMLEGMRNAVLIGGLVFGLVGLALILWPSPERKKAQTRSI